MLRHLDPEIAIWFLTHGGASGSVISAQVFIDGNYAPWLGC